MRGYRTQRVRGDWMSLDLEELPKYVSLKELREGKNPEKMTIRIVQFEGQRPIEVKISPKWTVGEVEAKLAKAWGKNPRTTRLYLGNEPLPKDKTFGELATEIDGQVLHMIPDTPVGAISEKDFPSLPFSIEKDLKDRIRVTNFSRIYSELLDLPYKPGYGQWFRVTLRSTDLKGLLFPILHIQYKGKWYPFQLVLAGYPNYIRGFFIVPPPCPHVYQVSGEVCWELEKEWQAGMQLYEDFIRFLKEVLERTGR